MDKKTKEVWNYFAVNTSNNETIDFAGVTVLKSAYGDNNSNFGWTIDHIYPQNPKNNNLGGSDGYENLQVCSIQTNEQKANNLSGSISFDWYEKNKYKMTVTTKYKVEDNFFFPSKHPMHKNGIIFIQSQENNKDKFKIKNKYFYDGLVFSFENDGLYFWEIDLETSTENHQIHLKNKKHECEYDEEKGIWIFPNI